MKHEGPDVAVRAFSFAGLASPTTAQLSRLEEFRAWLGWEATEAGMIGPNEGPRLWSRHVADSIVFAVGWCGAGPSELVDAGSGAGLPGIPLAVAWPETHVRLVDRSERRCRLLARAIRMMGLSNVTVECEDATALEDESAKGLVMRAFLPPEEAAVLAGRVLVPGGTAVLGGGRPGPEQAPEPWRLVQVPSVVLDDSVSLLIMTRRD